MMEKFQSLVRVVHVDNNFAKLLTELTSYFLQLTLYVFIAQKRTYTICYLACASLWCKKVKNKVINNWNFKHTIKGHLKRRVHDRFLRFGRFCVRVQWKKEYVLFLFSFWYSILCVMTWILSLTRFDIWIKWL